jgi:hypothetical protein
MKKMIITFTLIFIGFFCLHCIIGTLLENPGDKPISYPEEIQAVKVGDTLYVFSISDSIYIGFKPLNK